MNHGSLKRYAILYGGGPVGEHIRQVFPAENAGIDIRIHSKASAEAVNGRPVYQVDSIRLSQILEILRSNKITNVVFGGSPNYAILDAGQYYIQHHGALGIFSLTIPKIFNTLELELQRASITISSALSFDADLALHAGFNGRHRTDLDLEQLSRRYFVSLRQRRYRALQACLATPEKLLEMRAGAVPTR